MAIVPVKLYGIVSDWPNTAQLHTRSFDKLAAGTVALAQSARAISAEICFRIVPDVAVVPNNPDDAFRLYVIDFRW
jgi:hypothetical protein